MAMPIGVLRDADLVLVLLSETTSTSAGASMETGPASPFSSITTARALRDGEGGAGGGGYRQAPSKGERLRARRWAQRAAGRCSKEG